MSLLIFIAVGHDYLRTLLCESVDQVAAQEASAAEHSSDVARNRRTATTESASFDDRATGLALDGQVMDCAHLQLRLRCKGALSRGAEPCGGCW